MGQHSSKNNSKTSKNSKTNDYSSYSSSSKTTTTKTSTAKRKSVDQTLDTLFDKYCESDNQNLMSVDGITQMSKDLSIDIQDPLWLLFGFYCQITEICQFTRAQFKTGMEQININTIAALKKKLPQLRKDLNILENANFLDIYLFAFQLYKNQINLKTIDMDYAQILIKLFFEQYINFYPKLDKFIEKRKTKINHLKQDEWKCLFLFIKSVKGQINDPKDISDADAWPLIIDDFIEFLENSQ